MKHCRTKAARLFIYLIFSVFVVINVFPLLWLLVSSFKTNKEFMADLFSLPKKLMAENYVAAWEYSGIGKYVFNSVLVTVGSVSIILVLAVMIAYVLARYRFRGRNMVYVYFLFGMLIPIHTTLVPLFTMFKSLHWLNRWFTLFLPYISFYMPFAIYILESYIRSIPVEMDEAAVMDGAGRFQILFRIIFPSEFYRPHVRKLPAVDGSAGHLNHPCVLSVPAVPEKTDYRNDGRSRERVGGNMV